jgi:probable rRNA maturation factor
VSGRRAAVRATFSGSLRGAGSRATFSADLRRLARALARLAGRSVDLSVAIVTDREIARLHRAHLDEAGPTDVISFPLSGPREEALVGALAVSRDTAVREAARRGHPPYHELMLYVAHGALHLVGHDDRRAADRARMRRAERALLAEVGVPHVYGREP